MKKRPPIAARRYPVNYLCDVVYCTEPMPMELAETIRLLRREYKLDYEELGFYLCESDPDQGTSFGLGKALTELAFFILKEKDRSWK